MDPADETVHVDENLQETAVKKRGNPNFAEARKKAHEARRKMGVISRAKKEQAKQEREEEYRKALEFLNGPEKVAAEEEVTKEVEEEVTKEAKKPKKAKKAPRTKIIELTDSSSSDEDSSDTDSDYDIVKVVRKSKPSKTKPKSKSKRKPPPPSSDSDSDSDDDDDDTRLAGSVARDMLRKRVLHNAADEAIRRLVPGFKGFT